LHPVDEVKERTMAPRIGGSVADIEQTAGVMTDTGGSATETGTGATNVSSQMESEVGDVTTMLSTHFNDLAEGLRTQITTAKQRLAGTDWEGTSQAEATEAEAALNADVNSVLGNALESVENFRTFMLGRANDFVGMVQGDFNTIMGNIDTAYQDLSRASRTFAENLQLADETVRFSG
jgi:hypothetical protein